MSLATLLAAAKEEGPEASIQQIEAVLDLKKAIGVEPVDNQELCDAILVVLAKQLPPSLAKSAAHCLSISAGNGLNITLATLVGQAAGENGVNVDAQISALVALGEVAKSHPKTMSQHLAELSAAALKIVKANAAYRAPVLDAIGSLISSLTTLPSIPSISLDTHKIIKSCMGDRAYHVRELAANCMCALVSADGPLARVGTENLLSTCLKNTDDVSPCVRSEWGRTIGILLHKAVGTTAPAIKPQPTPRSTSLRGIGNMMRTGSTNADETSGNGGAVWSMGQALNALAQAFTRSGITYASRSSLAVAYIHFFTSFDNAIAHEFAKAWIQHLSALLASKKNIGSRVDASFASQCVTAVLRWSFGEGRNEALQLLAVQSILECLTLPVGCTVPDIKSSSDDSSKQDASFVQSEEAALALLRGVGFCLLSMGASAAPVLSSLNIILQPWHEHPSSPAVRSAAASILRCASIAVPSYTGVLCNSGVDMLKAAVAVVDIKGPDRQLVGTAAPVRGWGVALAAVIAAAADVALGVPEPLLDEAMDIALALAAAPPLAVYAPERAEAGLSVLASLMRFGPSWWGKERLIRVFGVWTAILGEPVDSKDFLPRIRRHAAVMDCMVAFVLHCGGAVSQRVRQELSRLMAACINSFSCLPVSVQKKEGMVLRERILRFSAVSLTFVPLGDSVATIVQVALAELSSGTTQNSLLPGMSANGTVPLDEYSVESSGRFLQDTLTACGMYRQNVVQTTPTSTRLQPMQVMSRLSGGQASGAASTYAEEVAAWAGVVGEDILSPTLTAPVRVVDESVAALITIFFELASTSRAAVLRHLVTAVKESQGRKRGPIMSNTLAVIIGCMRQAASKRVKYGDHSILRATTEVLRLCASDSDVVIRRAAGEGLGRLCGVGDDNVATQLVTYLTQHVSGEEYLVAVHGLALGYAHYSMGGMRSPQFIAETLLTLSSLASDERPTVHMWALQSLATIVDTAGPAIAGNAAMLVGVASGTLSFASQYHAHAFHGMGRLVAATIAALGPELSSTSPSSALMLKRSLSAASLLAAAPWDLSRLSYLAIVQQLLILSPLSVQVDVVWQLASDSLSCSCASLRQAAAVTLRQLINFAPGSLPDGLSDLLFGVIDKEIEPDIRHELELTLLCLIEQQLPDAAVTWITLCHRILAPRAGTGEAAEEVDDGDDEENMVERNAPTKTVNFSWRTKEFGVTCLRRVIRAVNEHVLIPNLQLILSSTFSTATSRVDDLRPSGINALSDLFSVLAGQDDPHMPGEPLMLMYEAQIMSALRPAFAAEATPQCTAAACRMAGEYLTSGSTHERGTQSRVLSLLTNGLDSLMVSEQSKFGTQALTIVALARLQALASVYVAAEKKESDWLASLYELVEPHLQLLGPVWMAVINDHMLLETLTPRQRRFGATPTYYTYTERAAQAARPYVCEAVGPVRTALTHLDASQRILMISCLRELAVPGVDLDIAANDLLVIVTRAELSLSDWVEIMTVVTAVIASNGDASPLGQVLVAACEFLATIKTTDIASIERLVDGVCSSLKTSSVFAVCARLLLVDGMSLLSPGGYALRAAVLLRQIIDLATNGNTDVVRAIAQSASRIPTEVLIPSMQTVIARLNECLDEDRGDEAVGVARILLPLMAALIKECDVIVPAIDSIGRVLVDSPLDSIIALAAAQCARAILTIAIKETATEHVMPMITHCLTALHRCRVASVSPALEFECCVVLSLAIQAVDSSMRDGMVNVVVPPLVGVVHAHDSALDNTVLTILKTLTTLGRDYATEFRACISSLPGSVRHSLERAIAAQAKQRRDEEKAATPSPQAQHVHKTPKIKLKMNFGGFQ